MVCRNKNDSKPVESATSMTPLQNKIPLGFTLAEVLITLGIIGVVAAMTIPNLIATHKAKRFRTQFLKSYSTIQQVFKQMQADDISIDPADYPIQEYSKVFGKSLFGNSFHHTKTQKHIFFHLFFDA